MKHISEVIICMRKKSTNKLNYSFKNIWKKDFLFRALPSDAIVLTQNISLEVQNWTNYCYVIFKRKKRKITKIYISLRLKEIPEVLIVFINYYLDYYDRCYCYYSYCYYNCKCYKLYTFHALVWPVETAVCTHFSLISFTFLDLSILFVSFSRFVRLLFVFHFLFIL